MKRLSVQIISLLLITSLILGLGLACAQQAPTTTKAPPATSATQPPPTTSAPAVKQVLIRMTTPVPAGDDLLVKSQAEMDKFNAETNGAYKMQMFPGGQLDQFPAMLDDIRTKFQSSR
ncbi:MAG: hypothetical protein H6Q39_1226 [Chloroflexi bacterium]|nr:hypothetical protein [Chloroflexota bacterium]